MATLSIQSCLGSPITIATKLELRVGHGGYGGQVVVRQHGMQSLLLAMRTQYPSRRSPLLRRNPHSKGLPVPRAATGKPYDGEHDEQAENSHSDSQAQKSSQGVMTATAGLWSKAPEPIRVFPWVKAGRLFLERLLEQLWSVGKWLAIPVLAVSMLSELSYTLMQEKVLLIPAGMIGGIAFCGILKETALELLPGIDKKDVPWHLVAVGLFFILLKYIGPYLPVWGRITVPHFANGGLWQTIKLVNDWRKAHSSSPGVQQN